MEPTLELEDIQGHILPGFASLHNYIIGVEIIDCRLFITKIEQMIDGITCAMALQKKRQRRKQHFMQFNSRIVDDDVLVAHSISGSGFKKLGINISEFVDEKIKEGMFLNAPGLNDKPGSRSDRDNWKFGTPNDPLDYLFILGSDSIANLQSKNHLILDFLGDCIRVTYSELCSKLPNDIEHFGFKDGISQPAVRGKINETTYFATRTIDSNDHRSALFAKPGQPLIWPGQFIFGYPVQTKNPAVAGEDRNNSPQWSKNGSFLVLRRLNQDVPLFQKTMQNLSETISSNYDITVSTDELMAKSVGRWKDGTPLTVSPSAPDQALSNDLNRINNFNFSAVKKTKVNSNDGFKTAPAVTSDIQGNNCPHFAHIRKVNPRSDGTDIGTEETNKKLILRRGIPFGSLYEEGAEEIERGLLFMAYQTSIKDQFEFIQRNWANSLTRPSVAGNDFIIGQPENDKKRAEVKLQSKKIRMETDEEWIFTTGGEYLFTPGLKGLKKLLLEAGSNV